MKLEHTLKEKYNSLLDRYRLLKAQIDQVSLFTKERNNNIYAYDLEQIQKELAQVYKQIEAVSIYKPTNQEKQNGFKLK